MTQTCDFSGRHYLVTGASSGIGQSVCEQLLEAGAEVTGVSRRDGGFTSSQYEHISLDLSDLNQADSIVRQLSGQGRESLYGMVLCHGVGYFANAEQISLERMQATLATNMTSCFCLIRRLLPMLKTQGYGDILAIGSESALSGGYSGGIYSASKFGLRGFFQSLRKECADRGVRVAMVNPGMVKTPFFDALHFKPGNGREQHLSAQDIANTVLFILSMPMHVDFETVNMMPMTKVVKKQ